jgi:uncharacterized protein YndB with AHSA1/START domain
VTATAGPVDEREIVITRVIDAPASLLFQAFSKPEHLLRWFGPEPYPLAFAEVDFRVGGRFRFAMREPNGSVMTPFGGEYLEIVPDRRIVYTDAFEQTGAPRMTVTVTFDEEGGRTTLTLTTRFETAEHARQHLDLGIVEGLTLALQQLADLARQLA